jgi:hypothetical protein
MTGDFIIPFMASCVKRRISSSFISAEATMRTDPVVTNRPLAPCNNIVVILIQHRFYAGRCIRQQH